MYHTFTFTHDRNGQDRRRRALVGKMLLWSLIGLLAGALAESAQAQIVINGAGSLPGQHFTGGEGAPLLMCNNAAPVMHLRSGSSDSSSTRHTWICNVTLPPPFNIQQVAVRYSVSESGDGYTKVSTQPGFPKTAGYIIDTTTCLPPMSRTVAVPPPVLMLNVEEYSNCTQSVQETVDFGASDVEATSFGQSGPTGLSYLRKV